MTTKREKTKAVLEAAKEWAEAYETFGADDEGTEATDASLRDAEKKLFDAVEILESHAAQAPAEDHPEGEYYYIEVAGKKIRRVRCKHCGTEMDPRGFKRHYKGAACEKARAQRIDQAA